ncbi:MAG: flagellar biosynthetic protein FliO [Planctomycetota bacterium]|nr:flagellar biosynthetic protein FliO [Planctomycetota bacterium]
MRLTGTTPSRVMAAALPALLLLCSATIADLTAGTVSGSNEGMPLGTSNGLFSGRPVADGSSSISMFDAGSSEIIRVLLALGVVIGLLLLVRWCIRRGSGLLPGTNRPQGLLKVHARYPMGRGHHLVLLQVGNRMLLVHQSAGRMQTLTEFSDVQELSELHDRLEEAGRGSSAAGRSAGNKPRQHEGGVVDLTSSRRIPGWRRLIGWRPVS